MDDQRPLGPVSSSMDSYTKTAGVGYQRVVVQPLMTGGGPATTYGATQHVTTRLEETLARVENKLTEMGSPVRSHEVRGGPYVYSLYLSRDRTHR